MRTGADSVNFGDGLADVGTDPIDIGSGSALVAAVELVSNDVSDRSESVHIDANIDDADSDSVRILHFVGDTDFPRRGENPDIRRLFLDTAADSVDIGTRCVVIDNDFSYPDANFGCTGADFGVVSVDVNIDSVDTFNDSVDVCTDFIGFSNEFGPPGILPDGSVHLDTGSASLHSDAVIVITDSLNIGAETMPLGTAVDCRWNGSDLIGAGAIGRWRNSSFPFKANGCKERLSDA